MFAGEMRVNNTSLGYMCHEASSSWGTISTASLWGWMVTKLLLKKKLGGDKWKFFQKYDNKDWEATCTR